MLVPQIIKKTQRTYIRNRYRKASLKELKEILKANKENFLEAQMEMLNKFIKIETLEEMIADLETKV